MRMILGNIVPFIGSLQSYFASPLAYAIAGIFWLLSGFFFVIVLLGPEGIIQQVVRNDLSGQQMEVSACGCSLRILQVFLNLLGL